MREYTATLLVTSPVLANAVLERDNMNVFPRVTGKENTIRWDSSWWHAALCAALKLLDGPAPFPANSLTCRHQVVASAFLPHPREYGDGRRRTHESVPSGATLTLQLRLRGRASDDDVRRVLEVMGDNVGLTPFGFRLGFGRFAVHDLVHGEKTD